MTSCEDLYREWIKRGNFCHKSDERARQIDRYIAYRRRYNLEGYEINECAMSPFMVIENSTILHQKCIKELRKLAKKIGGRNVTRRISIEIINRINDTVDTNYKIKEIPGVRNKMDGYQHTIEGISWETKETFVKLRGLVEAKGNNETMRIILEYLKDKSDDLVKLKEQMLSQPEEMKKEETIEKEDIFVKTP